MVIVSKLSETKPKKITASEEVPIIRIGFTVQTDGGRNPKHLNLETYVAQDISEDALNAITDKLNLVSRRNVAINERHNLKIEIKRAEKDIEITRLQVGKIESRYNMLSEEYRIKGDRRQFKRPEGEESSKRQLEERIETNKMRVLAWREELTELELEIHAGGA